MPIEMNRQRCCCFTGHREDKLQRPQKRFLKTLNERLLRLLKMDSRPSLPGWLMASIFGLVSLSLNIVKSIGTFISLLQFRLKASTPIGMKAGGNDIGDC